MFKYLITATLGCLLLSSAAHAHSPEHGAVKEAIEKYTHGSSYSVPDEILEAFYPETQMFLYKKGEDVYLMSPAEYADLFRKREQGKFAGRYANILDIDISGNIASAKAEILLPKPNLKFIDLFILKKIEGEWKIVGKAADMVGDSPSGKRVLFVLSNENPDAEKSAPVEINFDKLATAYQTYTDDGYSVVMASPYGGQISFTDMNMANPLHKSYVYDPDFMYALSHTLTAPEVTSADYENVHCFCDATHNKHVAKGASWFPEFSDIITDVNADGINCMRAK